VSGGHWDYKHFSLNDVEESLQEIFDSNTTPDEYGESYNYGEDVLEHLHFAQELTKITRNLLHSADYYVSGDIGEDSLRDAVAAAKIQLKTIVEELK